MQTILSGKRIFKDGYILLALLFVLSITTLFLLFLFSTVPNRQLNGFNRKFTVANAVQIRAIKLDIPLKGICGITTHKIYFTVPNLNWVISMRSDLGKTDPIYLGMKITSGLDRVNKIIVDSPNVFFFDLNEHSLYKGRLGTGMSDTVRFQTNIFSKAELLSDRTALIIGIDSSNIKQDLLKVDLNSGEVIARLPLKGAVNSGGFENDVMLRYDPGTSSIFLIEYFRNNIFRLDTGLQLSYSWRTIDTVGANRIAFESVNIKGEETFMPSTPRVAINRDAVASGKHLFIRSALKADNEASGNFRNSAVIDVYETNNGSYSGSFYIPDQQGEKLQSFIIRDSVITALFVTYVVNLQLPPEFR
ncbi:hypothetical protein GFS24_25330 [Chitinophaga sp. SYP-B3965]|uniref:hypothetical protein n=1 Tax=Chitinophaga sp. SYP-B3965 TaxID=2663120 RepID=UPI0012996A35|nr:hypothetical protein [Chitinophaga sp. SYP-B3965]MRG48463.1 hypothetical protein [Chitinophaga sp. SYP-B3965]